MRSQVNHLVGAHTGRRPAYLRIVLLWHPAARTLAPTTHIARKLTTSSPSDPKYRSDTANYTMAAVWTNPQTGAAPSWPHSRTCGAIRSAPVLPSVPCGVSGGAARSTEEPGEILECSEVAWSRGAGRTSPAAWPDWEGEREGRERNRQGRRNVTQSECVCGGGGQWNFDLISSKN